MPARAGAPIRTSSGGAADARSGWSARRARVRNAWPRRHTRLRNVLVARGLVARDGALQVAVLFARQEARLVERGQPLLGHVEVAGHQVQLARIFERAAVLRLDAQRLVVVLLGLGDVGGVGLPQA